MKKVLYRIFIALVLFVILLNLLSIFHISLFGFRLFRIGTGSMIPYLNINDYILVKDKKEYKEGDVITYKVGDNVYITHRIISINGEEVITKGDANNISDEAITLDNVVGKVIFKIGVFGFVLYLFSKPLSWVLLFIVGLVITIFLPDIKKKQPKKKEVKIEEVKDEEVEEKKVAKRKTASRKTTSKKTKSKKTTKKKSTTKKTTSRKTASKKATSTKATKKKDTSKKTTKTGKKTASKRTTKKK